MIRKPYFKKAVEYFEVTPKIINLNSHHNAKIRENPNSFPSEGNLREEMLEEVNNLKSILLDRYDNEINQLNESEKKLFYQFIEFYSICPICFNRNDKHYLKKFYFDKDSQKEQLRKKLLELMKNTDNKEKIIVGIPCCECYSNFF